MDEHAPEAPRPLPTTSAAARPRRDDTPLARLIAVSDTPTLIVDREWRIRASNPAFTALTGWRRAYLGQRCAKVIQCADAAGAALCGTAGCPLVALGECWARVARPTGERVEVAIHTVALGGERRGGRMALTLRTPGEPGGEGAAFLTEVAHKLRNRMNSLLGFVEIVASGQEGKIAARQRQLLGYAHNSAMEMMEYIENLLYLTRLDAGGETLAREAVAPAQMLAEVRQMVQLEADSAKVRLECDAPATLPEVDCDRRLVRQSLISLTLNALRFTPAGGQVRLAAARDGRWLAFSVADTGPGLAAADLPQIFERNSPAESMLRTGNNGDGLGLVTAATIARQHGGEIACASTPNQGATFTLRLPLTAR